VNILVTNDDGISSPGLMALAEAMSNIGEVCVLAPDKDWSGRGHVKTLNEPLRIYETKLESGFKAFASNGAPSDCVALGLLGYFSHDFGIVVSGINPAPNLGHDVTYSGTVTAAMEAAIWGVPGIAYSLDSSEKNYHVIDYQSAAIVAEIITNNVLTSGLPRGVLLNVNIPMGIIKGIQITHQGMRVYRDQLEERYDPRGNPYYWIGGDAPTGIPEEGTDIGALDMGFVSLTPLQLDLTSYEMINKLKNWQQDYNFPIHELETRTNGRS